MPVFSKIRHLKSRSVPKGDTTQLVAKQGGQVLTFSYGLFPLGNCVFLDHLSMKHLSGDKIWIAGEEDYR